MLPPLEATVKLEVVMVAGFIGLLKVAVINAVLGQTRVEPLGGVTLVTVGGARGEVGLVTLAPFLSGSPQPAITSRAINTAETQIFPMFSVRMRFSSLSISHKTFHTWTATNRYNQPGI